MIIKAIKFRENGFASQPFVFGGEEGLEKFDKNIKYRSGLQNYLIDTQNQVFPFHNKRMYQERKRVFYNS